MNRHIYGLTVFLFIVKTHFLLYWMFFAPINFLSPPQTASESVLSANHSQATPEIAYSRSCWRSKTLTPDLQNVALDARQGTVAAGVDFANFQTVSDLNGKRFVLHIFSADFEDAWAGEIRLATIEEDSTFQFKAAATELKNFNRKINYYARIESLSEHSQKQHDSLASHSTSGATPVSINFGKTGRPN